MKKFKLLASFAAITVITGMAAVSASAASSIELELDAVASTASTKVVNVVFKSTDYVELDAFAFDMIHNGSSIESTYLLGNAALDTYADGIWTVVCETEYGKKYAVTDGALTLATLKFDADDTFDLAIDATEYTMVTNNGIDSYGSTNLAVGEITVVNAEDAGLFADGEGDAVKAFTAKTAGAGTYTWHVTDGNRAKAAVATDVNGESDVIIGLTVTGEEVADITYAAITID